MNGTNRSRRGSHALRRRCPACGKLRKFYEPPGDQGGEAHPRRPPWINTPFGPACGWCWARAVQEVFEPLSIYTRTRLERWRPKALLRDAVAAASVLREVPVKQVSNTDEVRSDLRDALAEGERLRTYLAKIGHLTAYWLWRDGVEPSPPHAPPGKLDSSRATHEGRT